MKLNIFFAIFSVILLQTSISYSVEYQCEEEALQKVTEYLNENEEGFPSDFGAVFSCKSKTAPYTEIFQWGDGSSLVGIEYKIQNNQCVLSQNPYTGQDDGDLDIDWAREYCQDWED